MRRNILKFLLLLICCHFSSCSGNDPHGCYSVEIAPGKFATVKFSKWYTRDLTIQYSSRIVKWISSLELNRPQTLMEYEGKLYLLALEAKRKTPRDKWFYRCYRQEGDTFKEISAKEFPRSIAIFNLWRPGDRSRYSTGIGGITIDDAKIGCELNPEDPYFVTSYQARLWYMLEVENNLFKAEREFGGDEAKKFLREYIAKYKPVHLTSMEMKPVPKGECKF